MKIGMAFSAAALASGTIVSRLLGFVNVAVLAAVIGVTQPGPNAFALANQLPTYIYAIVAGGLLSAILVPHIVKAATQADGGQAFVNRLITLGVVAFLATTVLRDRGPALKIDTLEAFIRAVGTPHEAVWDERLRSEEVRIDGPLASVWTEYSFYAGADFSHCGVNAFQLARTADGWRIIALTDTRRRDGCPDLGGG